MTLAEAVFATIVAMSPPERADTQQHFPGHAETSAERTARYRSIAADLAAVVEAESPVIGGHTETAALLLAVVAHESGFARDVDIGPCHTAGKWRDRCDRSKAVCLVQAQAGRKQNRVLQADRKACLRYGLDAIRKSLATCRGNAPNTRLALLSGSCSRGLDGAARIWRIYERRTGPTIRAARP